MTVGDGFVNILSASGEEEEADRCFTGTKCNISIQSFTFNGYSEKSDWSGPAIASFDGCTYAERSCDALKATVKFFAETFSESIQSVHVTQDISTETEERIFCFDDLEVEFPNLKNFYAAKVRVYNDVQDSEEQSA